MAEKISMEDFREELKSQFARAADSGAKYVDITSGNLHRAIGVYPSPNHSMPSCCNAMYQAQKVGDEVLSAPPSGFGATVTIRYRLPRI
jgi:5-methylcytosine-specific restriction protein A